MKLEVITSWWRIFPHQC